jgi:hypothetical protein
MKIGIANDSNFRPDALALTFQDIARRHDGRRPRQPGCHSGEIKSTTAFARQMTAINLFQRLPKKSRRHPDNVGGPYP